MLKLGRGVLVAIEGIDGAGKTTQATLLEERLRAVGFEVVRTKEPTNGQHGRVLRESAKMGRLSLRAELDLFKADRREHVQMVIAPALERGAVVLVDRYYFSNAAYQGARGVDPWAILRENEAFAPRPDLLVLLQIDENTAIERIEGRGDVANHFEQREYLQRCAEIFGRIEGPYVTTLDGTLPIQVLHSKIVQVLDRGPLFHAMCLKGYLTECEPVDCSHRIEGRCSYPGLALDRERPALGNAVLDELALDPEIPPEKKLEIVRRAAARLH